MVNTAAAMGGKLPLASLNHISIVCRSVEASLDFYMNVLGFTPIRRPAFDFNGAWLFNYDIGIHLLQSDDPDSLPEKPAEINPKDNHISFQCESMVAVERRLKELGIAYIKRCVEEGGILVDQIFFHDPDGFMIEICNCNNLPVVPLADHPLVAACKRAAVAVNKQQQVAPPSGASPAVPSSTASAIQRVAEEAHISCA